MATAQNSFSLELQAKRYLEFFASVRHEKSDSYDRYLGYAAQREAPRLSGIPGVASYGSASLAKMVKKFAVKPSKFETKKFFMMRIIIMLWRAALPVMLRRRLATNRIVIRLKSLFRRQWFK